MKAKVLIEFRDKETNKVHKKNDIIEVTPARFNEIARKGRFIEAFDEAAQKAATEQKQ